MDRIDIWVTVVAVEEKPVEENVPEKNEIAEAVEAAIEILAGPTDNIKRTTERWLKKSTKAILETGEFNLLEDGELKPRHEELKDWISVYNGLVVEEKLLPADDDSAEYEKAMLEFKEKLFSTVTLMAEGEWITHCGLPKVVGVGVHMASAPCRKDTLIGKVRHAFRNAYYSPMNGGGLDKDSDKYLAMFRKFAQAADRHNRKESGSDLDRWIAIGRHMNALESGEVDGKKREGKWYLEECSIVRRGKWYNEKKQQTIRVYNVITPTRVFVLKDVFQHYREHRRFEIFMKTISSSSKYKIEQETRALEKLRGMLTKEQYDSYLITGVIEEKSKRSGLCYYVRRLKPTIVVRHTETAINFIIGLCLHPLAYYMDSFAGCLCPTDDVVSHLLWIRGDEAGFWKEANHHTQEQVEIGLP
jgi:uncharacterized protein YifE (UPF0438 family)